MSEYFEPIVQKLLETTDRQDAAQANLRAAAYEALMEMVKNSPRDCYLTVQKTTMVILERLQQVLPGALNFSAITYACLAIPLGSQYGISRNLTFRPRSI